MQQFQCILPHQGPAEQVALEVITPVFLQILTLGLAFNPFGHHLLPQFVGHGDDIGYNRPFRIFSHQFVDEIFIDFKDIHLQFLFPGQGGIASAKLIDVLLHAQRSDFFQLFFD